MIVKPTGGTSSNALFVVPGDSDDLFTLRRVVRAGDYVIADTTRLLKQEKEYGRPDRGERVHVRIRVRVERVELDSTVDRLRIAGTITDTDNELVTRGSHHALTILAGEPVTIEKEKRWSDVEIKMLKGSGSGAGFVLVAIDTQEAAVGRVSGTHVKVVPNIYSGQSGKRYQTKVVSLDSFFAEVAKTISTLLVEGDTVIIFGPGETRRRLYNFLAGREEFKEKKATLKVVEGVDVAGEDGIFVFLRSSAMSEAMNDSKLAGVSALLDKVMLLVQKGEPRFAMGIQEVSNAAEAKAIEAVVFSDSVFRGADEEQVVSLLNKIEGQAAKTYAVDSSTDIGLRVSSLGGIVALLRYAIR
ncbi:MAG: mRNA surveillance protein Pelota [Nitrososphaera sp.]|jgi:protein pelota